MTYCTYDQPIHGVEVLPRTGVLVERRERRLARRRSRTGNLRHLAPDVLVVNASAKDVREHVEVQKLRKHCRRLLLAHVVYVHPGDVVFDFDRNRVYDVVLE